jgi:hypothetical protein
MSETMDPRQRFLFSMLPGLLGQAYNYVRQNPLQATADVAQAVSPGGALQDALAGSEQISRSALRGDIGGMVGGAGAMGAGLLGAIPIAGMVGRAGGAAMRGASEATPTARAAGTTMDPAAAMARATAPQPGAGVPLLSGADLERANELSQRVLDFRRQQMTLPVSERLKPQAGDTVFEPPQLGKTLEGVPQIIGREVDALRLENLGAGSSKPLQLPGSRAGAGTAATLAENYGPVYERITGELAPIARIMRGEGVENATPEQMQAARAAFFYNMRPMYDQLVERGVSPQEALRRIQQEAQAIAGTSPRTDTEQNVLNSAFLQNRMARGLPIDAASVQAASGPGSGYGMIYDQHPALTQGLLTGTATLAQNPKPSVFGRNIAGDLSGVTADVHNVRAINILYNDINPGQLPASSFETKKLYDKYKAAYTPDDNGAVRGMSDSELREILVARPSGQGVRGQEVSTEYPIYSDITSEVGNRLGLTPADAQALMWFSYGNRTGLASEAKTVPELLNDRLSITAQALGVSPQEAFDLYRRNMIPLAGAVPAAYLGSGLLGGEE